MTVTAEGSGPDSRDNDNDDSGIQNGGVSARAAAESLHRMRRRGLVTRDATAGVLHELPRGRVGRRAGPPEDSAGATDGGPRPRTESNIF